MTFVIVFLMPVTAAEAFLPDARPGPDPSADPAPDPAVDATPSPGVDDPVGSELCAGVAPLAVPGVELCSHGPDNAPAAAAAAAGAGKPMRSRAAACIGNGRDGQRVEVLYVHRDGTAAASSSRVAQIRRWVGQVEWTVRASAERFGDRRYVRWFTGSSCEVRVTSRAVSAASIKRFETMIDELRSDGYSRSDRTYMLFVDGDAYCGIATAPRDDSASNNRADRTAGYARVDRGCWDTGDRGFHSIAAHELLHTLGAVQQSAPHGTPGAHCTDEHDLMCYDDGTGGRPTVVCRDGDSSTSGAGDANDRLLDCNGDDYFNTRPRSGSYLATHHNTADSARLYDPNARKSTPPPARKPPSPTGDPIGYVVYVVFG